MTIAQQNEKTLRPSMMVACGVDTIAEPLEVEATGRYGSGEYDTNMRAGKRGLTVKLMDLAGDGFRNDGRHFPISSEPEATDGDDTIVESYRGYIKYGIPAPVVSDSQGKTASIDFDVTVPEEYENIGLTAHCFDSNGRTYTVQGNNKEALLSAVRALTVSPGARLYIDRITAGPSLQWNNSNLIKCGANLRGVETKANSPELQMSDIGIEAVVPKDIISTVGNLKENSPIWYTAGYHDDLAPIRRFYLSEKISVENIVATVKGYDATKFLDDGHLGVVSAAKNGMRAGQMAYMIAKRCYAILSRGLIYNHAAEYARTPVTEIKKQDSSDTNKRYMSKDGESRRSTIAAYVNLFHSRTGGLNNSGLFIDYVDAGLPTFWAGETPVGESKLGREWELDYNNVSDFAESEDLGVSEISASVQWPKLETNDKGEIKRTQFYAEVVEQGDKKDIDTEEPYTGTKFREYKTTTVNPEDIWTGTRKRKSKIGVLSFKKGHFYPSTYEKDHSTGIGYSCMHFTLKSKKTAKQRLLGVRNVLTSPDTLAGVSGNPSYDEGTVRYVTGKEGEAITFPDIFYSRMLQTRNGSNASMWGPLLKQIGDRSTKTYKFKYRGNPHWQPRDIIHMSRNGQVIDMTIDNIVLEHENGGFSTEVTCRGGAI